MTSAHDDNDLNSQDTRNVNASTASTTMHMPARESGGKGSTRRGAASWRPYPSANRLAAAAPTATTARKKAESASRRKRAPSQRMPSGRMAVDGVRAMPSSARTAITSSADEAIRQMP